MKVKVIKKAELESLGERQQSAQNKPKMPKRRLIAAKVERWVADIRKKTEAESRVSLDDLFTAGEGSTT